MQATTDTDIIDRFRRLALALPDAVAGSHMGTEDFRAHDRIFATLAFAAKGKGTLKLTTAQQADYLQEGDGHFTPVHGGWGRMGMTLVDLHAPEAVIAAALAIAHRNVSERTAGKRKASTRA